MFDIGFSELLLFGVIALIVLGPEKLPQAARTAGQWYAKIRRTVSTLQSEIEAELDLAETRQQMQKELAKIRQTEADMRREMAEMRGNMKEFESSQNQTLRASRETVDGHKNTVNNEVDSRVNSNQAPAPKEFDYAYDTTDNPNDSQQDSAADCDGSSINNVPAVSNDSPNIVTQTLTTKPWENMWFRLGAYDKARRLPMPPYVPNYQADVLLNSPVSTQTSVNKQETD
ncbi:MULTISPECIES: Sec-independent protein translocase protein TatB [unclassified Psychrobacter]|uniref:Sec-independent protein translocase protein TatB n=1 Tax=unclassified Psychrobacter TaxID=196806 RepID=UPI0025B3BEF2|nr:MULTISPECIES: Sec-independent protein translocase protein TatB [unclassified Psychrobacter]MDN3453372.1 Sec-independent protein translocase protein TatB [Psychrobacter sp. APC 3350]MDN3501778.1 Sec-independent protein translocase protein TatB [Psychrobacter sp. 5A.1]